MADDYRLSVMTKKAMYQKSAEKKTEYHHLRILSDLKSSKDFSPQAEKEDDEVILYKTPE